LKALGIILVIAMGGLLIYASLDFPAWGDPAAPASVHVSPHYIEHTIAETSVPNMVTAVLADYRGYDTMFETIVIFTAGVACFFLLRVFRPLEPSSRMYRHIPTGITLRMTKGVAPEKISREFERIDLAWVPYDLVVKSTCRLIVPFCQLFALYVIAHGHHSPGGGFQGGVILGAAIILYAISNNMRASLSRVGERLAVRLCVLGVLIYAGTGALCILLGSEYLNYGALAQVFGTNLVTARSHGIMLVEIGVGITVMAVMIHLYYCLASAGRYDEGL
jgi:multicomponent Na+:H+ antiporter subunit B